MNNEQIDYVEEFVNSFENINTQKVVRNLMRNISKKDIEQFAYYNIDQVENVLLHLNPSGIRDIRTYCYILGMYAKWLEKNNIAKDNSLYRIIYSIDKDRLWERAKPSAKRKFISYKQYSDLMHSIEKYEYYNILYYQTLFSCLYEGIYCDDLSVIKNLRGSDINDDIITLREDNGHTYKIKIPEKLAENLKELAKIHTWDRQNKYSFFQIKIEGLYLDSCFKIEIRNNSTSPSYSNSYYSKLTKIENEYLGYKLTPLQIFISGIVYRIKIKLETNGFNFKDALLYNNRNSVVNTIVSDELNRCSCNIKVSNLREMIKGHLEVFEE